MLLGLVLNLLANVLWAIIAILARRLLRRYEKGDPRLRGRWLFGIGAAVLTVLGGSLLLLTRLDAPVFWAWTLVILASVWMLWLPLRELRRLWQVGIRGADRAIGSGLSYDPSLRLIQNELSFLGTGAHKLSRSTEFAKALRRCRSDVPIRLLLRRPDDPTLVAAARRAGRPENEYQANVVESLRSIARLREAISNIEVRFYQGDLVFRVMIVDRRIALVSYNVYGHGDGSELPQLHLVDVSEQTETAGSFFHAFERHFNERWREGEAWDFKTHL